ncbi:M23 family metallopeptidase [Bacillus niameyensis]|uniref:M23 family metallopeptidase n=1 Tax=Bacillus niameyensis TaxID=1522308 RepID=UPI000783F807|nr:M23 family metallopeptidase [Bacillus niameyensis]
MPFEGYRVTSPFGWIRNPITGTGQTFHKGIDLVKKHKAPIEAFTEGSVLFAGAGRSGTGLGGYGNVVVIKDKNGHGQVYAHLDRVAVLTGASVKKGQVIGYQGATGEVTGSHLHYEVRRGTFPSYGWSPDNSNGYLNPTDYLKSYYPYETPVTKPVEPAPRPNDAYQVKKDTPGYVNAADAKAGKNKKTTVKAGTYYIFNTSDGMINVTKKKGTPGSWINPNTAAAVVAKPKNKTLVLPKNSDSWRVYPLNKAPVTGNEKGFLNPKKFGGLTYEIIGNPQKDVYTIKTGDFGTVNIYAAPSTGAVIK